MARACHIVWIAVVLRVCGWARAQESVTCAVIADKEMMLRSSALVSLLEARLSQDERIQLLERAEIRAILGEQLNALAGLTERDSAMKVGQLLRVRAFVLLSSENTLQQGQRVNSTLIRVRVAETAHGLRLWEGYEQIDGSNAEAVAQRLVEKVTAAVGRLTLPIEQLLPIGIVDIHRVQLDERYDLLTRALPRLLSARLGGEPRFIVLERESLALLLKETQLTEGEDAAFWDSAILIDGHLQRANGRLEMRLRWRRAGDQGTVATPVDPNLPARAVEAAATELIEAATETSPSARWDPQKEAEEFFRQGDMLRAHKRFQDAFGPLETAYALQPEKLSYAGSLFENEGGVRGLLSSFGGSSTRASHYSDEQLAELASQVVRRVRRGWETGALSSRDISGLGQGWNYFANRASVSSDVVRTMNRENRRIWVAVLDEALRTQPVNTQFPVRNLYGRAALPWFGSDDPEELIDNVRRVYSEIILPPSQGGTVESDDMRCTFCSRFVVGRGSALSMRVLRESQLHGAEAQVRTLWFEYLDELSRCDDSIVRFFALAARAEGLSYDSEGSSQVAVQSWWEAVKVLSEELHGPASVLHDPSKWHACYQMKEILCRIFANDPNSLVETWERIYQPLIDRGNARALTWWDPGEKCVPVDPRQLPAGAAQRFRDLLARIEPVLEAGKTDRQISEVLGRVHDCRLGLESQYGLSSLETSRSAISVAMLLRPTDSLPGPPAPYYEARWELRGSMLHLATARHSGRLTLACVDLTRQTPARLVPTGIPALWNTFAGLAVTDETSYVAVRGSGVAVLPNGVWTGRESASSAKMLTQEHGLPSVHVTGMTADEGRLCLAYGRPGVESGLGLYDPKTGRWESFLCSTLKGEGPFHSGRPYALIDLVVPSPGSLFFINCGRMFPGMRPWMGLWRLDTTTRELKYYGYCGTEDDLLGHLEAEGKVLWCRGGSSLVRFNPQSEQATYVLGILWRPSDRGDMNGAHWMDCRNNLFLPKDAMATVPIEYRDRAALDLSTAVIDGDHLWALLGMAQIAVLHRGKPFGEAHIVTNDILDGKPVLRFVRTPYGLVAIGDGAIGLVSLTPD